MEQAIEWFGLEAVGRGASRFDFAKLENLNGHYLREADNDRLTALVAARLGVADDAAAVARINGLMDGLKERAKTVVELADSAAFLVASRPLQMNAKAEKLIAGDAKGVLAGVHAALAALQGWDAESTDAAVRAYAESNELKLGKVAQPLRAALSRTSSS